MSVDNNIKRIAEELGRTLTQSLGTSLEVCEAVRKIQQEGFALHLVLSHHGDQGTHQAKLELTPQAQAHSPRSPQASFRLNQQDVSVLQSLGIDPTRSARRRRGS